jgi:hypothetical protein
MNRIRTLSRFSSSLAVSLLRTTALMATGACVSCSWRDWRLVSVSAEFCLRLLSHFSRLRPDYASHTVHRNLGEQLGGELAAYDGLDGDGRVRILFMARLAVRADELKSRS